MYAKIHLSKNGTQTYITLVGDNHEPVFTSQMYDDVKSSVHAVELVSASIDRVIPDESITGAVNLMRRIGRLLDPVSDLIDGPDPVERNLREAAQAGLLQEAPKVALDKHLYVGEGNLCAECGMARTHPRHA